MRVQGFAHFLDIPNDNANVGDMSEIKLTERQQVILKGGEWNGDVKETPRRDFPRWGVVLGGAGLISLSDNNTK